MFIYRIKSLGYMSHTFSMSSMCMWIKLNIIKLDVIFSSLWDTSNKDKEDVKDYVNESDDVSS